LNNIKKEIELIGAEAKYRSLIAKDIAREK
jgi:hypothetical protein